MEFFSISPLGAPAMQQYASHVEQFSTSLYAKFCFMWSITVGFGGFYTYVL